MTCPQIVDSGVYVLGALPPSQRIAFEAHMAQCEECRNEVNELAVLPGLLGRIDASAFEEVDDTDGVDEIEDAEARGADGEAGPRWSGAGPVDTGSGDAGGGPKAAGAARSEDIGARGEDTGARGEDNAIRGNDSAIRGDDRATRGYGYGSPSPARRGPSGRSGARNGAGRGPAGRPVARVAAPVRPHADTILPGVLSKINRRRRSRRLTALAGALAVACLALVAGLALPHQDRAPAPAPAVAAPLTWHQMRSMTETPITAKVALTSTEAGTTVSVKCTYPTIAADPEYDNQSRSFALYVYPRSGGAAQQIGTWSALPGDQLTIPAVTSWSIGDVAQVELRSSDGTPLLSYDVT